MRWVLEGKISGTDIQDLIREKYKRIKEKSIAGRLNL